MLQFGGFSWLLAGFLLVVLTLCTALLSRLFRVLFEALFITLLDSHSVHVVRLLFFLELILVFRWNLVPFFSFLRPILLVLFDCLHLEAQRTEIINAFFIRELLYIKTMGLIPCLRSILAASLALWPSLQWTTMSFLCWICLSKLSLS